MIYFKQFNHKVQYLYFNWSPPGQNGHHPADIISDAFSWMKSFVLWLKFHWSLFLTVQLTITQYWFRYSLVPNRQQAVIWTNADLIHWHIYAALGGDETSKLVIFLLEAISALHPTQKTTYSPTQRLCKQFALCCHLLWFGTAEHLKNAYELLDLRALKISMLYKNCIFQCMGKIFFKGTLWNSTQHILPIHWKICILFTG